jgi:beta-lactamase class A
MPLLLLLAALAHGHPQDAGGLQQRILAIIDGRPTAGGQPSGEPRTTPEVGLVLRRLDGRGEMVIQPYKEFHAASTMKVPVMIELFRQAEAGLLKLDEQLAIRNEFHSIVDGSVYQLSVGDDSDAEVYKHVGKTMSLLDLNEAMITVSSNFAANLLIERLGVDNIKATVTRLGAGDMHVLRGVEDQKAFDRGLSNSTTARDLAVLLAAITQGRAASDSSTALMLGILSQQEFRGGIPAGVPPGTRVASKTGNITGINHDAAVIFPPGRPPYVLVILTKGFPDPATAERYMAAVSREVWQGLAAAP